MKLTARCIRPRDCDKLRTGVIPPFEMNRPGELAGWRKASALRIVVAAPSDAADGGPGREPWVHGFALSPYPLPRSGGGAR